MGPYASLRQTSLFCGQNSAHTYCFGIHIWKTSWRSLSAKRGLTNLKIYLSDANMHKGNSLDMITRSHLIVVVEMGLKDLFSKWNITFLVD